MDRPEGQQVVVGVPRHLRVFQVSFVRGLEPCVENNGQRGQQQRSLVLAGDRWALINAALTPAVGRLSVAGKVKASSGTIQHVDSFLLPPTFDS